MSRIVAMLVLVLVASSASPAPVEIGGDTKAPRQPQVAIAPDGAIHVAFGDGNKVYCATSVDGGRHFGPSVRVADDGELSLGMRRGPRVAATENAVVITAIYGARGKGADGDLLAWRSTDNGKSWSRGVAVNRVSGSAREGLHHTAAGPDGRVACVWLDLRNMRFEVFVAVSDDHGATWQPEWLAYRAPEGGVCPCCQPAIAFDRAGRLLMMWRNDLDGNRDMFLRTFEYKAGQWIGGEASLLGRGHWPIDRCPMDGGALAAGDGPTIETVWRRGQDLFRCRPGDAEEKLGIGEQAWVTAGPGGFYLVWLSKRNGELVMKTPDKARVTLARAAADPVVAAALTGKGPVVAAWEEGMARPAATRGETPIKPRIRVEIVQSK